MTVTGVESTVEKKDTEMEKHLLSTRASLLTFLTVLFLLDCSLFVFIWFAVDNLESQIIGYVFSGLGLIGCAVCLISILKKASPDLENPEAPRVSASRTGRQKQKPAIASANSSPNLPIPGTFKGRKNGNGQRQHQRKGGALTTTSTMVMTVPVFHRPSVHLTTYETAKIEMPPSYASVMKET